MSIYTVYNCYRMHILTHAVIVFMLLKIMDILFKISAVHQLTKCHFTELGFLPCVMINLLLGHYLWKTVITASLQTE